MTPEDDATLLHAFATGRDSAAFRLLVNRHLGLVHSVARRVTANEDLACDVTQETFIRLAAKAGSLPSGIALPAWLHRTARSLAIDMVRAEARRRKRELAAVDFTQVDTSGPAWSHLAPVIDEVMDRLSEEDRHLILLRYYGGNSHAALAGQLGLTEDTARRRVSRAIGKLRDLLAKRGITTTSAALGAMLPHAVEAAPAGMAGKLSSIALVTSSAPIPGLLDPLLVFWKTTRTAFLMKPILFVPPAVALLVTSLWITAQRQTFAALEKDNTAVDETIEAAQQAPKAATDSSDPASKKQAARAVSKLKNADGKFNWNDMVAIWQGPGGELAMLEYVAARDAMTPQQLIAASADLRASTMHDYFKGTFQAGLVAALAKKDPQLALEHFADSLTTDNLSEAEFLRAMKAWAAKDASASAAWLDRTADAGKVDSKQLSIAEDDRSRFECALLGGLLRSDPEAAARRIEAVPEARRADLLKAGFLADMQPGTEKASADFIRAHVPEKDRTAALADAAMQIYYDRYDNRSYEKISGFLTAIDPTPQERTAIAEAVVNQGNRFDLDFEAIHTWATAQAPADAERLTGQALASGISALNYDERSKFALDYQAASGSDDALVSFLTRSLDTPAVLAQARPLIEKVKDESRRASLLQHWENQKISNGG